MRIIHVGNDARGSGGIASVIRRHVGRAIAAEVTAVASYNQDARTFGARNAPALTALRKIVMTRPRTDTIWHVHLSQRGSIVREGLLIWAARARGHRAIVVTLHGSSVSTMSPAQLRLTSSALRPASVVHVLSSVHAALFGRDPRAIVIPNDVEVPSRSAPMEIRERLVLFAGELSRRKGVDLLVAAWQAVKPAGWSLYLCGPDRGSSEGWLGDTDGNVSWLGELSHDEVMKWMARASIVAAPSRAEALPMVICEAMAHGCAVIATDVGGTRDLLGAGNPWLLDPGLVAPLAQALRRLTEDQQLREGAGTKNRHRAQQLFDVARVNAQWGHVYTALVTPDPSPSAA